MLRADEIKDIVIKSLVRNGISGDAYTLGPTEQRDGRRVDMLYLPLDKLKESLAPVLVEVPKKIDKDFMGRVIRYALNVFDATGSYPPLVVISTAGFSSKRFRDTAFNQKENDPFYAHPCQSWAESTKFYTPESTAIHMDKDPLDKMMALCHVFFMQEKNIMLLEKYNDTSIQAIYKVTLDIGSTGTDKITKLTADVQSFCDSVECQLEKILNENNGKRQLKYAKDAVHFVRQFKRPCLPSADECAVTPIESACEQQESEDLIFVKEKRRTNAGRFNWANGYIEGRTEGLFQR
ncbi:hypothetical protein G6F57_001223 [Rhizopus arrhizus]|uniref:Uncharacterized protein n=1 Tax=Rhizopus oryzae TaxID=64495 RepID=A0A9P7BWW3_RHIOR|nr:hypothetical protein G6F30_000322 [Rhizopus arrhizus]KAG0990068.1 hypothetical protein G6F29_000503 [Rhizopus arrhizus]KAG0998767.1 hypothetical protein G6F28_001647 [Rhizopus arrhizus]KAG1012010.1 hypothetical protein G6F27_003225 [Rhizopus arrhizus]KAG1031124.1 hypothetical protein G6F26_000297 [Rhizopus arrhizus]